MFKKITILTLILAFAFTGLLSQVSQVKADSAASSASITNVIPVATSADIDSAAASVSLTENTTTTVTVTATITDNNGCEDIDSVEVKLYKTTTGPGAGDDENNHYTAAAVSDGNCTGAGDITDTYTATIDVYYYADPTDDGSTSSTTDWTAQATPSDESAGTADTDTIEMDTLTALDVTSAINYGELALSGDTGIMDSTTTVTNTGNEGIDVDVDGFGSGDGDGYSMTCTWGTIPVANEKYSATANVAYGSRTALSDTAAEQDMDIAQRTDAVTTGALYWGFGLPADGVGGTCSGAVVFTASSDPNLD